jgi:hypothetical protein
MKSMFGCCGLDCSKCIGYIATQSGSQEKLAEAARVWSKLYNSDIKPEHIPCDGCMESGRKSFYCGSICEIVKCGKEKKVSTCAACGEYPCGKVSEFHKHAPEAKKNLEQLRK